MKLPMVVYIIKNEVTGKIYVGRSSNLKVRVQQHMNLLRRGMHPVEDMQADFDEYGDHFRVIVIDKIETYGDRSKELCAYKFRNGDPCAYPFPYAL